MASRFVQLCRSILLLGAFSSGFTAAVGFGISAQAQADDVVPQSQLAVPQSDAPASLQSSPSQAASSPQSQSQDSRNSQRQDSSLDCPALQHALSNPAQRPLSCLYYTNHDQHNSTENSERTQTSRGEHLFPSQDRQSTRSSRSDQGRNGRNNSGREGQQSGRGNGGRGGGGHSDGGHSDGGHSGGKGGRS